MLRRFAPPIAAALFISLSAAGCSKAAVEPLKPDQNLLTVDNRTRDDWNHVEIWLNTYYRVPWPQIPAGGRFQVPLDSFVAGFGQRFDYHRTQVHDLRLTATLPDGRPLEIKKEFEVGRLKGALGGGKQ
jgi:hypothetical protein